MNAILLVTITLTISAVDVQEKPSDLDAAISTLEHWQRDYGRSKLNRAINIIRLESAVGDRKIIHRVLSVVENQNFPDAVRNEALKVVCEKADDAMVRELITLGNAWVKDTPEKNDAKGESAYSHGLLLGTLVTDGIPRFQRLIPEPEEQRIILSFLRTYVAYVATSGETRKRALEIIFDSPAPIEMRRSAMLDLVASDPNNSVAWGQMLDIFDESSAPKLRALVREAPDMEHFHWSALSVLAHHGDQEILPVLETWRSRIREQSRNSEEILGGYIWQISIQHPSTKLLDYIGSSEDTRGEESRIWAVNRAVSLGLPKSTVRDAILKYANCVTEVGKHGYRVGLSGLKKCGLELDVLREGDLPGVLVVKIPH